jgi:hypothetical protein
VGARRLALRHPGAASSRTSACRSWIVRERSVQWPAIACKFVQTYGDSRSEGPLSFPRKWLEEQHKHSNTHSTANRIAIASVLTHLPCVEPVDCAGGSEQTLWSTVHIWFKYPDARIYTSITTASGKAMAYGPTGAPAILLRLFMQKTEQQFISCWSIYYWHSKIAKFIRLHAAAAAAAAAACSARCCRPARVWFCLPSRPNAYASERVPSCVVSCWLRWNRHGRGTRNTTAPSELRSKVHVMARPSFDFRFMIWCYKAMPTAET